VGHAPGPFVLLGPPERPDNALMHREMSLTQTQDFDEIIGRRGTDSIKWNLYDEDVLPLWIADMDFLTAPAVRDALRERVDHGIFGYVVEPVELREILVERLRRLYAWKVEPEAFLFLPSVVCGFNLVHQSVTKRGDGVLLQPPVYFPIRIAPKNSRATAQPVPLVRRGDGRHEIDFDALEAAVTKKSRMFMLCNPHNPVGRSYSEQELAELGDLCVRHRLTICSDEIHGDFVYDGARHVPIASLSPEIEAQTVTLIAPSKSFNIAGLHSAVAIIPNKELRERVVQAKRGLVPSVSILGYVGMLAAYRDGEEWFAELFAYVEKNRNFVHEFIKAEMPEIQVGPIEATYLAWLDCRGANLPGDPYEFFLREARVATNPGPIFGPQGEGFIRLNFACPRAMLAEGLTRMRDALRRK
jgi:cystathionine beta-lyase